jgi:THUMP domain-like/Methyltransferase domain
VEAGELEWLRGAAGQAALASATRGLDAGVDVLAVATSLRSDGTDPALASAALTQAQLRLRGRAKFGEQADHMYWTAAGLEQATRASVAEHRAARYARLGPHRVADLCCGVGGDLLALADAGLSVLGVDRDEATARVARANIAELGFGDPAGRVEVRVDDVSTTDLAGCDAAFLDPARRTSGGRRRFDPQGYSPPYSFALELAAQVPATGLKVAPGIPHDLVPPTAEAEWVSVDGDVKEAALWFGPLTEHAGRRRATLLTERAEASPATLVDDPSLGPPPVAAAGRYLHEPDGAVIRAGLVAEVAHALGGWLLDPSIAYVSTDEDTGSPFTKRYVVEEVVPFQLKRLRAMLRERGVGDVVVKKRGSAVEPEELRRRLRLDGDGPTRTLILTRIAGTPVVLLTDPG